ncbi:hypothetical protein [Cryptosporangium arvum]|uniref:hypothetical protein n=1 Tax=Cryptosporangium arvum TaxID=80871 RepID=UPI0004B44E92|nr:hypothetical protein [Cryptosporangium arvum]
MRPRTTARRLVRVAGLALAFSGLLTAAACSGDDGGSKSSPSKTEAAAPSASEPAAAATSASPSPSVPPPSLPPAAAAGGLCASVTFTEVRQALGLTFQIAAASGKSGSARTCVLTPLEAALPDLTFVATPLGDDEVSAEDYEKDFVPDKTSEIDGLGRAGYQQLIAATGSAGPVARIGWLGDKNVYTLSLATEQGTGSTEAKAYLPKLQALAPKVIPT